MGFRFRSKEDIDVNLLRSAQRSVRLLVELAIEDTASMVSATNQGIESG
jgi:hypothetical protein